MTRRIDVILQTPDPLLYPGYMAKQIGALLEREGFGVHTVYLSSAQMPSYLRKEPPSALLTFEPYISKVLPFQRLLGCPEFFIAQNAHTPVQHLLDDPGRRVLLLDRNREKTEFFVHPVEKKAGRERKIPLAACIDLESTDSLPLLTAFGTLPFHLFGDHKGPDWYRHLPESVHLHSLPPHGYLPTLFTQIEIVICDLQPAVDGPPEHFFQALASGALPLTPPTKYLQEVLGEESPLFYRSTGELVEKSHFYLAHPTQRRLLVEELHLLVEAVTGGAFMDLLLKIGKVGGVAK